MRKYPSGIWNEFDKMESEMEALFDKSIRLALEKLNYPGRELKKQQYRAIRAISLEKKDVLTVLPTGFGKSLIYQVLPSVFDCLGRGFATPECEPDSVVLVVSPLNALMRDQIQKLQGSLNVRILQSTLEDDSKVTIANDISNYSLIFGHLEVFVENKTVSRMLKAKAFHRRVKAIVVDEAHLVKQWSTFRPAYGKLGFLTNLFPSIPVLALTGTATRETKLGIIDVLGLSDPVVIECNPDRTNIYYASHVRADRGENKLDAILDPVVAELKLKKKEMPLTLIYENLETNSDCFLYFSTHMGKDQYYSLSVESIAKNRLFSQYHANYPETERKRIVDELVKGTSNHRVLFVTVAFGIGIDCSNIHRIIHIGVPYSMEEYCQEVGRAGRDGLPARADIYYNAYDISKSRKSMTDVMRSYVQFEGCKRKVILSYFGYDVQHTQQYDHLCCDFHRDHCSCDNCELALAVDQVRISIQMQQADTKEESIPQSISTEDKNKIKEDLEVYRMKLQREIGRSTVGSTALSNGFPIELISLVLQHISDLTSVEKVATILPVYSKKMAQDIFYIICNHLPNLK